MEKCAARKGAGELTCQNPYLYIGQHIANLRIETCLAVDNMGPGRAVEHIWCVDGDIDALVHDVPDLGGGHGVDGRARIVEGTM